MLVNPLERTIRFPVAVVVILMSSRSDFYVVGVFFTYFLTAFNIYKVFVALYILFVHIWF